MASLSCIQSNTVSISLSTPPVFQCLRDHLAMVEKPPDTAFAHRFAECLRDLGMDRLSQSELGAKLGVTQGMAGRYLKGKDKPKGRNLEEMAILFDVCQEWLLTGRGPKRPGRSEDDVLDMAGLRPDQKAALGRYAIRLRNTTQATTTNRQSARVVPFAKK